MERRFALLLLLALLPGCQAVSAPGLVDSDLGVRPKGDRGAPIFDVVLDGRADSAGHGPPYPIILAHGFFGFEKIGPLTYFWRVKETLEADGHLVYITAVDPFNSTYFRGEQLLEQAQRILVETGAARVNLIGHSQGGLDARYVAARLPGRVASVTTIGTPHLGVKLADDILGAAPGLAEILARAFFAAIAVPFWGDIAKHADIKACLEFLTTASMADFNASHPDVPGVQYRSIGARSNSSLAESACQAPLVPPFIARYLGVKDPIDPMLYLTGKYLGESLTDPVANDGVAQTDSMRWGSFLGCIPADHWDEIGHLFGDSPGESNTFDHLLFYRELVAYLVAQGL